MPVPAARLVHRPHTALAEEPDNLVFAGQDLTEHGPILHEARASQHAPSSARGTHLRRPASDALRRLRDHRAWFMDVKYSKSLEWGAL